MRRFAAPLGIIYVLALFLAITDHPASSAQGFDGRQIFRFDTFGDEQLWTKELRMHEVIPSVSPQAALAVGPEGRCRGVAAHTHRCTSSQSIRSTDPAVTVELLRLNAVVGVIGGFNGQGNLTSIGITCALCHSTVDNSLTAGIGRRLDGWPNRDLDVGTIVGLSPVIPDDAFSSWGPGKYDPRDHAFDGKNIITLNSPTLPVLIPPAYGLLDVPFETYTADG